MAVIGRVEGLEPLVSITLQGTGGNRQNVRAIVDTGFTGYLTLPLAAISSLGLALQDVIDAELADGSIAQIETYRGTVDWQGVVKPIVVCATEGSALLGMMLLDGSTLVIEAIDGGTVTIS